MRLSSFCIRCLVDRQAERIAGFEDEYAKGVYMKKLCRIISEASEEDSVPVLVERINRVYREMFGELNDFTDIKKEFNALMLSIEEELEAKVRSSADPLETAMLYARAANYIDFGAFSHVSHEKLFALLDEAAQQRLDAISYAALLQDLQSARRLVYITDNCGEVVADKLVLHLMQEKFHDLQVFVLVRGVQALNDVTREDADYVGLTDVARVVSNGCGVTGTPIEHISEEARALLREADVVVAKGQGNFETMNGCGLNVYYSFLCKCEWFQMRFGLPQNTGVFIREKDYR